MKRAIAAANQSRMAKRREQESESLQPSRAGALELGLGLARSSSSSSSAYNFFITELNRPCDLDLDLVANSKGLEVGGGIIGREGRRVGLLAWCGYYKEFHHLLHPLFSTLQSPQAHLDFSARRFATKWDPLFITLTL